MCWFCLENDMRNTAAAAFWGPFEQGNKEAKSISVKTFKKHDILLFLQSRGIFLAVFLLLAFHIHCECENQFLAGSHRELEKGCFSALGTLHLSTRITLRSPSSPTLCSVFQSKRKHDPVFQSCYERWKVYAHPDTNFFTLVLAKIKETRYSIAFQVLECRSTTAAFHYQSSCLTLGNKTYFCFSLKVIFLSYVVRWLSAADS